MGLEGLSGLSGESGLIAGGGTGTFWENVNPNWENENVNWENV